MLNSLYSPLMQPILKRGANYNSGIFILHNKCYCKPHKTKFSSFQEEVRTI